MCLFPWYLHGGARRWQLSRVCPYDPIAYEAAAAAAASHPSAILRPLSLQQLAYVATGFASAQHPPHAGFLTAVGDEVVKRMAERATQV